MRGRTPKPIAVHEQNGNPSKLNLRKLKAEQPRPPEANHEPPTWLTPEARKIWGKLFPILAAMRVMSGADEEALAQLCEHAADARRYTRRLVELRAEKPDGDIITLPSGYVMMHPYVARRDKSSALVLRYLAEFGLTPSARNRVKVSPEEQDELLAYLAGMN